MSDRHAAIDIGTNSVHLVVAQAVPGGGFDVLTTEKLMVRLGEGGGDMKQLSPAAMDRGIAALRHMAEVTDSLGADVVAVATSAVREARNRNEFITRARTEAGIDVEVISGIEEARIIHLGVLQALPVFDLRLVLVDIGGGSTEILVGEGDDVLESRSFRLGAIRLTERFFPDGTVTAKSVKACRKYVRAALAPALHHFTDLRPEIAIGSSGTISTIASMAAAQAGRSVRQMNGETFTIAELRDLVTTITEWDHDSRADIPGIDERRSDIIVGGSILLLEVMRALEAESMTVSSYALREGVLYDRFGDSDGTGPAHLANLRNSSAQRLAQQLDPDPHHALHISNLAGRLFDLTTDLHHLVGADRELLLHAATLHNIGLSVSHSGHHKHSAYVIRHSENLSGFTERERELIAQIARYHRKSQPRKGHDEYAALDHDSQRIVSILAGILRIAIGLDRRHAHLVSDLGVEHDDATLTIQPTALAGEDIDLELYSARVRSSLLARELGIEIRIEDATRRA